MLKQLEVPYNSLNQFKFLTLIFQVLSRAALAAHDTVPVNGPNTNLNIDYHRTLECSVPGPQVRTRPRQLDVATIHGFPKQRANMGTCRVASPVSQPQSHIYMEVDPLYSTFNPGQLLTMCEPQYIEAGEGGVVCGGLVSSTSSQTSSGYSTAPSDNRHSSAGNMYEYDTTEYGDTMYQPPSSQDMLTKDVRYSISQPCEFQHNHANSQRQKKSEVVMNNILLQQTNREVM